MESIDFLFRKPSHWVLMASIRKIDSFSKKALLCPQEQNRCDRFRRQEDQQRYVLAHTLKRYCLARYLACEPEDLLFGTGAKGKPYCTLPNAPAFNLSHSGDYVMLGVSSIADVGVDVEFLDRSFSADIIPRVLSHEQQLSLSNSQDHHNEFLYYWTQKEAISKALGVGLSIDFQTVTCSGVEGEHEAVHSGQTLLVSTQRWCDAHVISVASTASVSLNCFEVASWQGDDFLLDKAVV